jgi:hypothetical protein
LAGTPAPVVAERPAEYVVEEPAAEQSEAKQQEPVVETKAKATKKVPKKE